MALSAPRLVRKRVLHVTTETTKGTLANPTTDVLVFEMVSNPVDPFVERKGSGKFLGHTSPGVLEGTAKAECSFKCELRGDGASGMDPALAILLQSCGLVKAAEVYTPTSVHATQKTCSLSFFEDGIERLMIGCMGNWSLAPDGGRLVFDFNFEGVWEAPTDQALPTAAHSTRAPLSWGNASNAFTLATEAIKISTFTFSPNNQLVPRFQNGRISYSMITDRDPVWTMDPESDLIAGYDFYGAWLAGTEVAISLAITDGTDTVTFAVPKFQYRELKEGDRDGISIEDLTGQCNISNIDTGDDEFSLTVT